MDNSNLSNTSTGRSGQAESYSQRIQQPDRRRPSAYAPIAPAITLTGRSTTESTNNPRSRKKRRAACRDCRQAKLRCEGSDGGAQPCTRCRELSIECIVDLDYKRVNKKIKLNELSEQLEQLRSAVLLNGTAQNAAPANNTSNSPGSSTSTRPVDQPGQSPQFARPTVGFETSRQADGSITSPENLDPSIERFGNERRTSKQSLTHSQSMRSYSYSTQTARSLEHITLTQEQIGNLFQVFFEHYHPFFGILDPAAPPDLIYSRSPLLFWTIILIASRQDQHDVSLLTTLLPCVKKLVWSTIAAPPHSLASIKAISLLCMWPFPTSSMSTDVSFMLAAAGKNAATHIGLHRPEILQDFSRVKCQLGAREVQEAVKVWAGCYIAAECVTIGIGQSSLFTSDWAIERACGPGNIYNLPKDLQNFLMIQKFSNRVHRTMGGNEQSPTGYPVESESNILMTLLERDFEDLERQIGDSMNPITEILLLSTCLHLRIYYLFEDSDTESRKQGLLKAYASSLTMISKTETADMNLNFIKYAPSYFTQLLVLGAILVMKIVNSSYSRYVDVQGGKRTFNTVLAMLRRCSVIDNDLNGRVSKILAQLWSAHQSIAAIREQEPRLTIKSRFSASVLHDSLWLWRDRFGDQEGSVPRPPPPILMSEEPSATSPSAAGQIQEAEFTQTSSSSAAAPSFSPHNITDQLSEGNMEPMSQITYVSDSIPSEFVNNDFNVGQEELDWMWHVGFPSLLPVDLDFNPTTAGLGYLHQSHISQ